MSKTDVADEPTAKRAKDDASGTRRSFLHAPAPAYKGERGKFRWRSISGHDGAQVSRQTHPFRASKAKDLWLLLQLLRLLLRLARTVCWQCLCAAEPCAEHVAKLSDH